MQAPQHQRAWIRAGILVTLVGYGLAFASIQLEQPWAEQGHPRELYVMAASVLSLWLERRGRAAAAASILLSALWMEIHMSLMLQGARAAAGGTLPALVTGAVLFLGPRTGRQAALSTLVSVPGAVVLGSTFAVGPGIGYGDLLYLVAIEASTIGTFVLIGLLMDTLGRVLHNAEHDARRIRELIDGAPDAIVCVNEQGIIEDANSRASQLLGPSSSDLVGSAFSDLHLQPGTTAGAASGGVRVDELADGSELVVTRPGSPGDGSTVVLESAIRRLARQDGSRDTLVLLRDVSQRKQAEEHAMSLTRQLQHSQKLEALGKLAGGVSHDFNNLLMAVGGYGEALAHHSDARVREIAARLLCLRERAAGLTGQLLAFARKGMTQPEGMDLSRIVSDMSELLPQLIGPRVRLRLRAATPAWIHADPAQLEQVLLNLALNARDAMPDGGTLAITCTRLAPDARVVLEVSDNGTGMDEATRQQAFEPFFTTKPRSRGTGLGLSLVHGIVEASGGSLELSSTPGCGTIFTLSWPEHRPEHAALPAPDRTHHLDAAHPCLATAEEERTPPPSSAVSLRSPRSWRAHASDELEVRSSQPVELEPPSTRNREDEERRL